MNPTDDPRTPDLQSDRLKLVEIRTYRLKPGTGAEFHRLVATESVPLHALQDIEVVAYGQSLHDPDAYVLMRAFRDLEHLESSLSAFYASDAWRDGPRKAIVALILADACAVMPFDRIRPAPVPTTGIGASAPSDA